jgi:hypothetical protein
MVFVWLACFSVAFDRLVDLATDETLPQGFSGVLGMCAFVCFTQSPPATPPPSPPPPPAPPLLPPSPPPPMSPCVYPPELKYLCRSVNWDDVSSDQGTLMAQLLGQMFPPVNVTHTSIEELPMTCSTGPKFLYCDVPYELFAALGLSYASFMLSCAEWKRSHDRFGPLPGLYRRGSRRFRLAVDVGIFCVDMASLSLFIHVAVMTSIYDPGGNEIMPAWVVYFLLALSSLFFLQVHFLVGHWSVFDQGDGIGQYLLPQTLIERRWKRIQMTHEARFQARWTNWASREPARRASSSEILNMPLSLQQQLTSECTQEIRQAHTMEAQELPQLDRAEAGM